MTKLVCNLLMFIKNEPNHYLKSVEGPAFICIHYSNHLVNAFVILGHDNPGWRGGMNELKADREPLMSDYVMRCVVLSFAKRGQ